MSNGSFFRDYKIDPEDKGTFVESWKMEDAELTTEHIQHGGITTFERESENHLKPLRYFVRVGGGYRGFKKRKNAINCLKEPL